MPLKRASRRRDASRVGEPLAALLARYDPEGRLRAYRVFDVWSEVVGEAIAQRAQPDRLHEGVLTVQVSSHTWMQELQFLKEDICRRLNERLGAAAIRDLRFTPGRVRPARAPKKPEVEVAVAVAVVVPELPATGSPEIDDVLRRIATAVARRRAGAKKKRKKRR